MTDKDLYVVPVCETVSINPEGIIAASNIEDLEDGGKLW